MTTMPEKLTATNCAAASDGGSVWLSTVDPHQREYHFHLDWSLEAQKKGTTQFYVNSEAVLKGSQTEELWLRLLADADVCYSDIEAPDEDYSEDVGRMRGHLIVQVNSEAYRKK